MGIKTYRPITSTLRYKTTLTYEELTTDKPFKALTKGKSESSGRGAGNQISVRRRGGGHKKKFRVIDFKRNKFDIPAKVETIEYDPNRSANIALLCYRDGERRYIIAPETVKVGDQLLSAEKCEIRPGNSMKMKNIPVGTNIYNIELHLGKGGQLVRSAGTTAQITGYEDIYCIIKLPSGEMRKVHSECMATVGTIGNKDHSNVTIGKAGRSRWLNKRPSVRGCAMNPVDHPLGGGEGKSSGKRHPVSPTGVPTKGYKTRKKKKYSNSMIISKRK